EEERNRVAILAIAVDDRVLGRRKTTVGPALQQIGDIDHEGAVDGRHADPIAALVTDLQSSERILPQDREAAAVAMPADTDDLGFVHDVLGRIMVELQDAHRLAMEIAGEIAFLPEHRTN